MKKELTTGNVQRTMLLFAGPMIFGNLLQQCYNIADTLIVGRFLGAGALAAVGSSYTLMTFLTSVLIGLCMGSGSVFSFYFGKQNEEKMREAMRASFLFVGAVSVVMNIFVFAGLDLIFRLLRVPEDIYGIMREYVWIIFWGIFFVFLYNYFSFLLRAVGDSVTPLCFLAVGSVLNIVLDLMFVVRLHMGVAGAAWATVLSQIVAGAGIFAYTWAREPGLRFFGAPRMSYRVLLRQTMPEIIRFSAAASVQQSVMNFGILMIQGLVNSFGTAVMAAFAAAVKIDSFAYMPAQEFGNSFSIFISQNYGAGNRERVREGVHASVRISMLFCIMASTVIFLAARYLMLIFISSSETEIIQIGVQYLRIEGAFYCGIGMLFLLYGYYRGTGRPEMSLILTVISLGTRVVLAYALAPVFGVAAIWCAIPTGWLLADLAGVWYQREDFI